MKAKKQLIEFIDILCGLALVVILYMSHNNKLATFFMVFFILNFIIRKRLQAVTKKEN